MKLKYTMDNIKLTDEKEIRQYFLDKLNKKYGTFIGVPNKESIFVVNEYESDQYKPVDQVFEVNMIQFRDRNRIVLETLDVHDKGLEETRKTKKYDAYATALAEILYYLECQDEFINKLITDLDIDEKILNNGVKSFSGFLNFMNYQKEQKLIIEKIKFIFSIKDFLNFFAAAYGYLPKTLKPKSNNLVVGGQLKNSKNPKASEKRIQLNGEKRNRIVFIGNHGKEFIKMSGEFVSLSVAKKMKSKK